MRILLGRVKGDKGERGAQGPRGPQGERGPQGPPGEPGQTDIYTRAESDARYQLKSESVDFNELARRIPSWQWKVTLPKSDHQTVMAITNGQIYTSDFYAQQGSNVTFGAKADAGYTAGIVSPRSVTLTSDLTTVTVTAAKKGVSVPPGSIEIKDRTIVTVPKLVTRLEFNFNGENKYLKVRPQQLFWVNLFKALVMVGLKKTSGFDFNAIDNDPYPDMISCSSIGFSKTSSVNPLRISWSDEINKKYPNADISAWRDARQ